MDTGRGRGAVPGDGSVSADLDRAMEALAFEHYRALVDHLPDHDPARQALDYALNVWTANGDAPSVRVGPRSSWGASVRRWTPPSQAGGVDFFIIFFSDLYPGDPGFDDLPEEMVCLHCLIDEGDEQLAEGLDLAPVRRIRRRA
jgi:hypothetical protein